MKKTRKKKQVLKGLTSGRFDPRLLLAKLSIIFYIPTFKQTFLTRNF